MPDVKRPLAILVVEDDKNLRTALSFKLKHEGFKVFEADNGQNGLLTALDKKPDLVLTDIVMPAMDGLTMISKLREDIWGKDVKIIVLTNISDNKKMLEALNNNVFEYTVKSDRKIESIVEDIKTLLKVKDN